MRHGLSPVDSSLSSSSPPFCALSDIADPVVSPCGICRACQEREREREREQEQQRTVLRSLARLDAVRSFLPTSLTLPLHSLLSFFDMPYDRSIHSRVLRALRAYLLSFALPLDLISSSALTTCRFSLPFSQTPIIMVGSSYKAGEYTAAAGKTVKGGSSVTMTLEELLPMSFGPEELELERKP